MCDLDNYIDDYKDNDIIFKIINKEINKIQDPDREYVTLGKDIYDKDNIIKTTLEKIIAKEKDIITNYNKLLISKDNLDHGEEKNKLIDEIEKHKLFLLYKLQTKEQQYNSLYKILEYLSFLDNKEKHLEIEKINQKMKNIQLELIPYQKLIF